MEENLISKKELLEKTGISYGQLYRWKRKNIYPLYLHDIAEIYGTLPNEYGIFEHDHIKTLIEQYDVQKKLLCFIRKLRGEYDD